MAATFSEIKGHTTPTTLLVHVPTTTAPVTALVTGTPEMILSSIASSEPSQLASQPPPSSSVLVASETGTSIVAVAPTPTAIELQSHRVRPHLQSHSM